MKRSTYVNALTAAVLMAMPVLSASGSKPPNLVVIMVDDLGYSDIGCYGAEIETPHPTRDLRPVSGVSLRPVFEGKALMRTDPIYLQFAYDWGLRDGDWKLVSFKGQEWDLYNMANDRTELRDLAKAEPERLKAMVATWKEISANVLHHEKLANAEVSPAEVPRSNREWTPFNDADEPPSREEWAEHRE